MRRPYAKHPARRGSTGLDSRFRRPLNKEVGAVREPPLRDGCGVASGLTGLDSGLRRNDGGITQRSPFAGMTKGAGMMERAGMIEGFTKVSAAQSIPCARHSGLEPESRPPAAWSALSFPVSSNRRLGDAQPIGIHVRHQKPLIGVHARVGSIRAEGDPGRGHGFAPNAGDSGAAAAVHVT